MENLDQTHPGAKEELMKIGISVRRNDNGIGQAVDLAGEQTYMRSAKTAGGITHFQSKKASVLKWVRSRPYQAMFTESLKEMTILEKTTNNLKKCLRPSEIIKSNNIVAGIIKCMENQFYGPFDEAFDNHKLYNLVSGRPVPTNVSESLLGIDKVGGRCFQEFELRMVSNHTKAFFDPIKRNKQLNFKTTEMKLKVKNV